MEITQVKISKLKPSEYNPRKWDQKTIEQLTESIKRFGIVDPIIANSAENRFNVVIGGHFRLEVAKRLGYTEVPVYYVNIPDIKMEQELNLRLNKNLGDWDFDLLANFDDDLLKDVGFESKELDKIFQLDFVEDDFDADAEHEKIIEPRTSRGDVYILGKHKIMCGDATSKEDMERLMDGAKADMAFNDPPYGMRKEKEGVKNDNQNRKELIEFNKSWINIQLTFLKDNASFYCWGTDQSLLDIYSEIIRPLTFKDRITLRNLITWDKGNAQGQLSESHRMYPVASEKCLFVMLGVQEMSTNADQYYEGWEPIRQYLLQSRLAMGWSVKDMKRIVGHSDLSRDHWTSKSQWTLPTREVYNKLKAEADKVRSQTGNNAFKAEYDEIKAEFMKSRAYFDNTHEIMSDVWRFNRDFKNTDHPTPKPVIVCERAIKSSCPEGGIVIDSFLGSGSTLIACQNTNRICYGMEIDEKYCDVIVTRYCNHTGINKVIKNGETIEWQNHM